MIDLRWAIVLLLVYVLPTLIALARRTSMLMLVCVLNVFLGWTIVGWEASLALAMLLPYHRAARPASSRLEAATPAAAPGELEFLLSPVRVAVLSMFAPLIYQYWWFWRFFQFARAEGFPRTRSFWWVFVPFYGWAIIGRLFHDLDDRLGSARPADFNPQVAVAFVVAGYVSAGSASRSHMPLLLIGLAVSIIFSAVALYQVQTAANAYLRLRYPTGRGTGPIPAEVLAAGAGLLFVTLLVLETPNVSIPSTPRAATGPNSGFASSPPLPSRTPFTPPAPAGPWYGSGVLSLTSEPGDYILQGRTITVTSPSWKFLAAQYTGADSVEIMADSSAGRWIITLAAPRGQVLRPGSYQNAERAAFRSAAAPGIDIDGENRGCNQTYGSFSVTAMTVDSTGNLTAFEASFEQHCESPTAPALRGSVKFAATGH